MHLVTEKDVLLNQLEAQSETWKHYKEIDERAEHMNPDAIRNRRESMGELDVLLDKLNMFQRACVELIPIRHTHSYHPDEYEGA